MFDTAAKLHSLKGMISEGSIPRYLCKFRPIYENDNNKSIFTMLEQSTLWFTTHDKFNDPFDYKIKSETDCTKEELIEFHLKIMPQMYSNELRGVVVGTVEQIYQDPENLNKYINSLLANASKNDGICCFSKSYDHILQWSHYADSHTGVCLVYDILEDPELFWVPLRMKYEEEYPTFNFIKRPEDIVEKRLQAKSKIWEYEEEFRVIKPDLNGLLKVNKSALSAIIFGCHIDVGIKSRIIKNVSELGYCEKLYFIQASTSLSKYELQFEPSLSKLL